MRNSLILTKTPGPGNYEPDSERVKGKLPSWSLSKSSRDVAMKSIDLGPGQYEHDKNYKSVIQSSPKYNFGGDKKLKE